MSDDVFALGQVFAASGYFADARDAAQCTVKILAGRELGLPPFASMTGIHIIKGRPTMGANLIAARIKSSGKYSYRVLEMSDQVCRIAFFEGSEQIGVSEFSLSDAKKAGTQNLDKFPRNMLFARAISNGAKWYCPDLFITGVYVPEEMGAVVDAEGEVIHDRAPALPAPPRPALPAPSAPNHRREKLLARIAQLGGDVARAQGLSEEDIIAYGKELKELAAQSSVVLEGLCTTAHVSPDVCRFSVADEGGVHQVVVYPDKTCWHQVVRENEFVVENTEVVRLQGRLQVHPEWGKILLAEEIGFPDD